MSKQLRVRMSEQSLKNVRLSVYWDLVHASLPMATSMSLVAIDETVITRIQASDEMLAQGDDSLLTKTPIYNPNDELLGYLIIGGIALSDRTRPARKALATCIAHEIGLGDELDIMARELGARYEELNLVYHTEDQVGLFREGRDALDKLIENCRSYLDVTFAALILRDKGIQFAHSHRKAAVPDMSFLMARLRGSVYDWIVQHNTTVAINDQNDDLAQTIAIGIPFRLLCAPISDSNGEVTGIMVTANSYSKRAFSNGDKNLLSVMAKKASKIIQSNYDALTGLLNRGGFDYFVNSAIEQARSQDSEHVVMFINVDSLHVINDTADYATGDMALRNIAGRIRDQLREQDVLSRLGGDRFAILVNQCSLWDGERVAEKIRSSIAGEPLEIDGGSFGLSLSIGVAPVDSQSERADAVVAAAEVACSVAKDAGGDCVQTYQPENSVLMAREQHIHLVGKIQRALSENRFVLFGQPIVPLSNVSSDAHVEVLLRIIGDSGKIEPPASFMDAAERYFLMPEIDKWVVSNVLKKLPEYAHCLGKNGHVAINLSGQSIGESEFLDFIHRKLDIAKADPSRVCFEITETAAVSDIAAANVFINSLRERGCSFSLDDFGSGLSSFSYLKNMPVDYLKIDGELVKDIVSDPAMEAMVRAIHDVGSAMNLETIAEYVEDDAIKAKLAGIGVTYGQGFGIARPAPLECLFEDLAAHSLVVSA